MPAPARAEPAQLHPSGGEAPRGALASGVRAVLHEFVSCVGGHRAAPDRLRVAAWVRLLLVLPLIALPTGLAFAQTLESGKDPETAHMLVAIWLAAAAFMVLANVVIAALGAASTERRAQVARVLTFVTLTAELLSNQVTMHALGPLTSHGALYTVVIVAVYRVFFDYRLGLYAAAVGGTFYLASVWLGFTGVLPSGALLPAFEHLLHEDAVLAALAAHSVIAGLVLTFCAVNFATNQSVKLHHYMTESVLRRYLPPSLVERAARGELSLDAEPERRVITVMFTDIVGFTSMSERIGERDVARLLNQYLSRCAAVVHAHGATIDKFIGDAVMVLVGAPDELAPKEQVRRCVAIARDMRAALADSPLQVRAGINTGEVIVGHFGSEVRSDFTAVGHAVNMASRLESACEPGRILVGEETARLLEPEVAVEPAGEFQLKGISQPVRAYYVLEADELASERSEEAPAGALT